MKDAISFGVIAGLSLFILWPVFFKLSAVIVGAIIGTIKGIIGVIKK